MTDIALIQDIDGRFDIALEGGDLVADETAQTAVVLSLLTDRVANADDVLPDGSDNRRGYWADAWPPIAGDLHGSRLWLLSREKDTPDTRRRSEAYALEALQWLKDDSVAKSVATSASTIKPGALGLLCMITRADGSQEAVRFNYVWEAL